MKVLIVEDNKLISETLRVNLTEAGYSVACLYDGESAKKVVAEKEFDIILLDLGLPKVDGLSVLKEMRKNKIDTPVLILTAENGLENKVEGLNIGADDYVSKPFDIPEIIARINALIRRHSGRSTSILEYQDIVLDPLSRHVTFKDKPLKLSRHEFSLLKILLENKEKVVMRDTLMHGVYGWDENISSNALEVHICNLRKKLNNQYIHTIRGVGYSISN